MRLQWRRAEFFSPDVGMCVLGRYGVFMNNTATTSTSTFFGPFFAVAATCPIDGETFDVAVLDSGAAALLYISDTRFDFPDHTMTITRDGKVFHTAFNEGPPQ